MRLVINGEAKHMLGVGDAAALMAELGVAPGQAALELNGEIIPRSTHAATVLTEGDIIEIVQFIGGG